jgi:hypothetical protein
MDVYRYRGRKKVFHIRYPLRHEKKRCVSDVSKTLNQPLRGKPTNELRLAL